MVDHSKYSDRETQSPSSEEVTYNRTAQMDLHYCCLTIVLRTMLKSVDTMETEDDNKGNPSISTDIDLPSLI